MSKKKKGEIVLKQNDWFTLNESDPKSLFSGVNIHLRNNSANEVKVISDESSILITVEKK